MFSLEQKILQLFSINNWTLSCAESCTGGQIAAQLTKAPNASCVFVGSVVAYSNPFKQKVLQVCPSLITKYSPVSFQVAEAMAEGIMDLTQSTIAISTTGIAGPGGGTATNPIGTVWIGLKKKEYPPFSKKIHLIGSREEIIISASNFALLTLYEWLNGIE